MMLIATHKDFKLKHNWKDTIIIDGGECKNTYSNASMLHENEHPSKYLALHGSYVEISRLLCAWQGYNMQYKRQINMTDEEISNILKDNDAILPNPLKQHPNIARGFARYHREKEIEWCLERIPKIMPEYAEECERTLNGPDLRPHNVFIMKRIDFLRYGYFLKRIYDTMDKELGYNTYEDIGVDYKLHGCLTERISNIFYNQHFKKVHSIYV